MSGSGEQGVPQKSFRWLRAWAPILAVAMILAACAADDDDPGMDETAGSEDVGEEAPTDPSDEEPVTLLVWDQLDRAGEEAEKIYALFEEKHPHISIEREFTNIEVLRGTARTAMTDASGPDVVYTQVAHARDLLAAGLVRMLDDYADQYGWFDHFYQSGLDWTLIDDQLIGLGLEAEFVGWFINNTIFEEEGWDVPQTHEETLEYCRTAADAGYVPLAHSQDPGWQNYFTHTMPIHNFLGAEYMEGLLHRNEGSWDSPEMVRALETVYVDMAEAGCFPDDLNAIDYGAAIDLFLTGESPIFPTGTWVVDTLVDMEDLGYEVEMQPWVEIEGGQQRVYTLGMGSAWIISENSENQDAAAEFINFLFTDEEALRIWVEEAQVLPPVPFDAEAMDVPDLWRFVIDTIRAVAEGTTDTEFGWNIDLIAEESFNQVMWDGGQAMTAGQRTVAEQVAELQAAWEATQP